MAQRDVCGNVALPRSYFPVPRGVRIRKIAPQRQLERETALGTVVLRWVVLRRCDRVGLSIDVGCFVRLGKQMLPLLCDTLLVRGFSETTKRWTVVEPSESLQPTHRNRHFAEISHRHVGQCSGNSDCWRDLKTTDALAGLDRSCAPYFFSRLEVRSQKMVYSSVQRVTTPSHSYAGYSVDGLGQPC